MTKNEMIGDFLIKEKMVYTGAFFDNDTILKIISNLGNKCLLEKNIPNKHVTFCFKPKSIDKLVYGYAVGTSLLFRVVGFANNGKNSAIKVDIIYGTLLYKNLSEPHITLFTSNDGLPKDSAMLDFIDLPENEQFEITGVVGYFNGKEIITNMDKYPKDEINDIG